MRQTNQRGFTLIELLVVVAILGVLVGLSIPVIGRANVKAQQTKCLSNMRQIGLAMMTYAGENNNWLPETTHTTAIGNGWIDLLAPYLSNMDEVRICPADPLRKERLISGGTSYVLNSYIFVPAIDPFGRPLSEPLNHMLRIPNPSQTMMAFVVSENQSVGASTDHTHSNSWTSWAAVTNDISPDRFATNPKPDHSIGSSNYLFADGHVQAIHAQVIKSRIDSGDNIAVPQ